MNKRLCIATPAYGGMVHMDWHDSIMSMWQAGIEVTTICLGNESLITRARNTLLRIFHKQMTGIDKLFFLDADCGITGQDVKSMMNTRYDVIAAPVALKGMTPEGKPHHNVAEPKDTSAGYQQVKYVGTAALMLSRRAVTDLVDNAISCGDVYKKGILSSDDSRIQAEEGEYYDVFKTSIDDDGIYLSEDYHVCQTLRGLGYNIIVDPRIKTRHNGNHVFLSH